MNEVIFYEKIIDIIRLFALEKSEKCQVIVWGRRPPKQPITLGFGEDPTTPIPRRRKLRRRTKIPTELTIIDEWNREHSVGGPSPR